MLKQKIWLLWYSRVFASVKKRLFNSLKSVCDIGNDTLSAHRQLKFKRCDLIYLPCKLEISFIKLSININCIKSYHYTVKSFRKQAMFLKVFKTQLSRRVNWNSVNFINLNLSIVRLLVMLVELAWLRNPLPRCSSVCPVEQNSNEAPKLTKLTLHSKDINTYSHFSKPEIQCSQSQILCGLG